MDRGGDQLLLRVVRVDGEMEEMMGRGGMGVVKLVRYAFLPWPPLFS